MDKYYQVQKFLKSPSLEKKYAEIRQLEINKANLIVILTSESGDNNFIVVAVSPSLQKTHSAIEIFKNLGEYKTQGGGNANLAQGKYQKK
jgi:alanyl-tRNA synthetase